MYRRAIFLFAAAVVLVGTSTRCKTNQLPTINSILGAASIFIGGSVELTCDATDPDGDPLTYVWSWSTGSMSSSAGRTVTWTAPDSGCTATISVTVSDGRGGSTSADKNITVDPSANRPPSIDAVNGPDSLTPRGNAQYACDATDPENDSLTYNWSSTTGELSSQTGQTVTWSAPDSACTAKLTVIVEDENGGADTADKSVVVTVAANKPPTISSISGPDSVDAGGEANLTCNASDPDGDSLSYSWSCTVGGLSSSSGRSVTWYAPDSSCSSTITAIASDGNGGSDTAHKAIGVRPVPNRPPVIDSISGPSSVDAGGQGTYTCHARDPDGDSLTYFWECTRGHYMTRSQPTAKWYAPDSSGSAILKVTVSDGRGKEDDKSKTVSIRKVTTTWHDWYGTVPASSYKAWYGIMKAGYTVWGHFRVEQKDFPDALDINFYIMDSTNYFKWVRGQSSVGIVVKNRSQGTSFSAKVPRTCRYYAVLDNKFSLVTPKVVELLVKLTTP